MCRRRKRKLVRSGSGSVIICSKNNIGRISGDVVINFVVVFVE